MSRLLLIAVFLEIGVVLLIVPWTRYWERNYIAESVPYIEALITNDFVRGAVSGLGLLNLYSGVAELLSLVFADRSGPEPIVARPASRDE